MRVVQRSLIEGLEFRRLLHGVLDLHVNFQPASAAVPAGYVVDSGQAYADRGNGWVYGWNAAHTADTRDRGIKSDQRYDTFIHTQTGGSNKTWELAVANGEYQVHVVAGDPSYFDSIYKINVENVLTVSGTPTSGNRFIEGTQIVNVTDGRLTISSATGASNNKIAFVDIESYHSEPTLPAVSIAATHASASENGESGEFTVTRTGATTNPLTVIYQLAGSATNGTDYEQLLGSVTIPAGASTATFSINPINDSTVEPSETAIATILADDMYTIGSGGPATVTIADNDSTGVFSTKINFQPATASVPAGYLVDAGNVFGDRGNGLTYGWNATITANTRDRNNALSLDQRYDTLIQFNTQKWELAVPNGTYSVRMVAGDAQYFDTVYQIDAEGVRIIDGMPNSNNRWFEGQALVNVTDGRLTVSSGPGFKIWNKLDFIEIAAANANTPVLNVSAGSNAQENGPSSSKFTITRTGSTADPLTVYYTIGGTATNGVDYDTIISPIVIPAGQSFINIDVVPHDDPNPESLESVTLTLVSQADYAIGASSNAAIRIVDNDTPVGNTITWATKASYPVGRAEALKAVVDGKLYVFGGFGADGPVNNGWVYDPAADKWTALPAMPKRLTHTGVAVDGHDIYVAGGYIGTGTTGWAQQFGTTDVWKYNIDTKLWTAFKALPKAVAGGGLVTLGRELHWVGGNNNSRQDIGDHYILSLDNVNAGWQTSTPLPFGRSHLGVVTLGGKIYAIGGQFGNDELLTTQKYAHVWDPANPSVWTRLADLPTAISHIASATIVYGNRILTLGGETAHTVPTDLVYAYDPLNNSWTAMTKLPAKRFSGVAAELEGELFFTTGGSQTTSWKGTVS